MNIQNYKITTIHKKRISETNFNCNINLLNYTLYNKQDNSLIINQKKISKKNLSNNELCNENKSNKKNINQLSFINNCKTPITKQKSAENLLKKKSKKKHKRFNSTDNNIIENNNNNTIQKINKTMNNTYTKIYNKRKYRTISVDKQNSYSMDEKNKKAIITKGKFNNNNLTINYSENILNIPLKKSNINYINLKIKSSYTNKIIDKSSNTFIKKIPTLINPVVQKTQKTLIKLKNNQILEKSKKIPLNQNTQKKNTRNNFIDNILSNKNLNIDEIKQNVKKIKEEITKENLKKKLKQRINNNDNIQFSKSEITNKITTKKLIKKSVSSNASFINYSQLTNKKIPVNLNTDDSLLNKIVSNKLTQKKGNNIFTKVNIINKKFNTIEYNNLNKKDNKTISKNSRETKEEDNDTDSIGEINKENNNNNISKSSDSITDIDDFCDNKHINRNHNTIHQIFQIHKINRNNFRFSIDYFKENKEEKNICFVLKLHMKNIEKIIFYDKNIIYTLNGINRKFHNFFKSIIYERIKNKVLENQKNEKTKNIIKKYLFRASPIYSNIKYLEKIYYDNLYKCESLYDNVIKADLPRTFPNNDSFKEDHNNYNKLYRILTSYSNYNIDIGYAQGLNLIAGHLIFTLEKEEEIFLFIDGLIHKFNLENLIGIKNIMKEKLNQIGILIQKNEKKVYDYLDKNYLDHEFFSANWTLTLMANSMKNKNLMIIWDYMIIFGWKFYYYFIITVLNFYENIIINSSQDDLPFLMKNLLNSKQFDLDFNNIINNTFYNMENHELKF